MDDSLHNEKHIRMLEMMKRFESYMEMRDLETTKTNPSIITGAEVMMLSYLMRYML